MFWLDVGAEAATLEELVAKVDALARVAAEVDARLAGAGVGGLDGALALCARLRAVFDGISTADLERMVGQVAALQTRLEEAARRLVAVRELKATIDRLQAETDPASSD